MPDLQSLSRLLTLTGRNVKRFAFVRLRSEIEIFYSRTTGGKPSRLFSFSEKETKTWGIILLPHSERTVNNVAIYHLETKIITRDVGWSVVAAAAYISCSKIYNDYDDIQYDQSEPRPRKRKSLDEWER